MYKYFYVFNNLFFFKFLSKKYSENGGYLIPTTEIIQSNINRAFLKLFTLSIIKNIDQTFGTLGGFGPDANLPPCPLGRFIACLCRDSCKNF
jgi:hypothetical protein